MKRRGLLVLLAAAVAGGGLAAWAVTRGPVRQQYLVDYHYIVDRERGYSTTGHVLLFNPAASAVSATLRLYFEDREPETVRLKVPPFTSGESNFGAWPVKPGDRFSVVVESREPLIAQATVGWSNTLGRYEPSAPTQSPKGQRETAKSYMAIPTLTTDCGIADGIVINDRQQLWIRESEWAVILNPGDANAEVTLQLYDDGHVREHSVTVPARRRMTVMMDPLVTPNRHYGMRLRSTRPVAAQWLRQVDWYDADEVMAFWSVPCTPITEQP